MELWEPPVVLCPQTHRQSCAYLKLKTNKETTTTKKHELVFWLGTRKNIVTCTLKIGPGSSLEKGQDVTTWLEKTRGRQIGKHKKRAFEIKSCLFSLLIHPSVSLCLRIPWLWHFSCSFWISQCAYKYTIAEWDQPWALIPEIHFLSHLRLWFPSFMGILAKMGPVSQGTEDINLVYFSASYSGCSKHQLNLWRV